MKDLNPWELGVQNYLSTRSRYEPEIFNLKYIHQNNSHHKTGV